MMEGWASSLPVWVPPWMSEKETKEGLGALMQEEEPGEQMEPPLQVMLVPEGSGQLLWMVVELVQV